MSKAPPEAVVFDLGKVLVDFDYSIAARKIAAVARKSPGAVQHLIDHTPLLYQYETGQLTRTGFFDAVVTETGFAGTLEEFSSFFADIFSPIEPMVELHGRLRRHRIPIYIFSNTNDLAVGHIRHNFPFFSQLDGYVLSYEEGTMKPEAKIYEAVERVTGRQGTQIVYLDDRPENVAAGRVRGWEVIEHRDPAISIRRLQELGLPG